MYKLHMYTIYIYIQLAMILSITNLILNSDCVQVFPLKKSTFLNTLKIGVQSHSRWIAITNLILIISGYLF